MATKKNNLGFTIDTLYKQHSYIQCDIVSKTLELVSSAINSSAYKDAYMIQTGETYTLKVATTVVETLQTLLVSKPTLCILAYDSYPSEGQNKMLKILEETHELIHILILFPRSSALLQTIMSRCVDITPSQAAMLSKQLIESGIDAKTVYRIVQIMNAGANFNIQWINDLVKFIKNDKKSIK